MKEKKPIPVFGYVNGYAAKIYGHSLKEHMTNIPASIRAQLLAKALHGYEDNPSYGWADWGGWEFGGEIRWPSRYEDMAPSTLIHPVEKPSDVDRLPNPNPKTAGSLPFLRQFNRELVKLGMAPKTRAGSVTTIVAGMIGMEKLMKWYFKEPEAVRAAYEKAARFLIDTAEETVAEFGPRCSASFSAPWDANSLISPNVFEKFTIPHMERIIRSLVGLGITSMRVHLCGDHQGNLPAWTNLPWPQDTIISIGSEMGVVSTAEAFGHRFRICGNVSTTLLAVGRYEDVYDAAWKCMEQGKDLPGGFGLMPACEMPTLAPPLNVQALVNACRDFNRNYGLEAR